MRHRKILPMTMDAKGTIMKRGMILCLAIVACLGAARAGTCSAPQTLEEIRRCDPNAAVAVRKNELFLSRGSSVLALRTGQALERATVLIPLRPGREIVSIHPALDAIYVLARGGGDTHLLRVPVRCDGIAEIGFTQKYVCHSRNCRSFPAFRSNRVVVVPLPVAGSVAKAHTDPSRRGITLWFAEKQHVAYVYDPSSARFGENGMVNER
jgi:hypothetical protein